MIAADIRGARGMGLEVRSGPRPGYVILGLTSAGERLHDAVVLDARQAGELARALAVALRSAARDGAA